MLRTILRFYKNWALPISMVMGVVLYFVYTNVPFLRGTSHVVNRLIGVLQPTLIFAMLFFTFCKINPIDLRLRTWHTIALGCQLLLTVGIYYGLLYGLQTYAEYLEMTPTDIQVISQGIMVCVIMPTATAAPIIAGKLGGSIQNLTTFSLLSNLVTALVVPAFFLALYAVPVAVMSPPVDAKQFFKQYFIFKSLKLVLSLGAMLALCFIFEGQATGVLINFLIYCLVMLVIENIYVLNLKNKITKST